MANRRNFLKIPLSGMMESFGYSAGIPEISELH
jgi:hypothetical protein